MVLAVLAVNGLTSPYFIAFATPLGELVDMSTDVTTSFVM
jgi:hypothetical protein